MKKILFISELSAGGVERVNYLLAKAFKQESYEVYFLSVKGIGKDQITDLDYISLDAVSGKKAIVKIICTIKRINPDYIFTCNHTDTFCSVIYTKLINKNCKSIFTVHSVYSSMFKYRKKRQLILQHYIPKILHLYNKCDAIVYVSNGVKQDFKTLYKIISEKEYVVYNPVFETMPIEKKQKVLFHNPLKLVTVGRLEEEKRQDVLIKTVAELKKHGIESELYIYGEGSLRGNLKELSKEFNVENQVFLQGFSTDIFSEYLKYDVFVFSSEFESFGNVIVEAMAVGLPVIVNDCPVGPREILKNGKYGKLVKKNEEACFTEKIIELIDDGNIISLIEKGKKEVFQYSSKEVIKRYIEILLKI